MPSLTAAPGSGCTSIKTCVLTLFITMSEVKKKHWIFLFTYDGGA
jgi:hypothetical protein